MANTQYSTEQLAKRFIDQREIQNVMGKYVFTTMICRHADVVGRFWAKADGAVLGLNDGWYIGREDIDGYYKSVSANTEKKTGLMKKLFPKEFEARSDEEAFGAGVMCPKPITTPVIEVAADGNTAKGLWQVMGVDSDITARGPVSIWRWGYMAADFVLEGDEWKVWHLQMFDDLIAPVGSSWASDADYPILPDFEELASLTVESPTLSCSLYTAYHPERLFTAPPEIPQPYDTFVETFSYGI
jgi:hypothetical protein